MRPLHEPTRQVRLWQYLDGIQAKDSQLLNFLSLQKEVLQLQDQ